MLACPNGIHLKTGNELKKNPHWIPPERKRSKFCIPQSGSTLETPVIGRVSGSWKRVINGKSFFKVWGDQRRGRGLASVYECGGQPKRPQGSQEGIHSSTRHTSASLNPPRQPSSPPPSPPQKMSWTNANRPAPSSSTISYELGAYHLQKASCFHAPELNCFSCSPTGLHAAGADTSLRRSRRRAPVTHANERKDVQICNFGVGPSGRIQAWRRNVGVFFFR